MVRDARQVREKVSLTGQYASVDEDLTGHENLVLMGRLLGLSWREARARAVELLDAFGLDEAAGRQVQTYSGGMRRRIDIAASLVAIPEILFLDEPTTGLDPRSRNQVWELVRRIAAEGTTVLLTTQYLDEADRLAERMAVIDHGRVIAEGTSRDLKAMVGSSALHLRLASADQQGRARELVSRVLGDGAAAGGGRHLASPPASPVRPRPPTSSPRSPGTAWRSPSSPWGIPVWTRCSSHSPAARPRPRTGRRSDDDRVLPTGDRTHQVLSVRGRPRPASALSAVATLAWRAMLKIKHVPFQLFDVTVMPIMFTLLFTYIFGGALAGSPREYIQYLLPGVLVQTIIFITVYTGVGLNTDIHKGLYDRFRSLPMWQPAPLFGALAGDLFRYSVASA